MPSPFPGMDPFIEQQKWTSFHTRFITELCDVLVSRLSPRYEIDPEDRIYADKEKEHYAVVRQPRGAVVTVIEVLSPTNKRKSSDSQREYLTNRGDLLRSASHLVEVDLLLGGVRLPTRPDLKPTTDYCALVSRADRRPRAEVFEWGIRQPLPAIPIPVLAADPDVLLDLQTSLSAVYARAHFQTSLDYREPLELPIRDEDQPWVHERLEQRETTR